MDTEQQTMTPTLDEAQRNGQPVHEPRKLTTPRLEVTLDDGRVLIVQTANPDMLAYDRTASKHGWPALNKAPILYLTFVAWAALRRQGVIDKSMTWDAFSERHALEVRAAPADGDQPEGETTQDPTPEALDLG